MAALKRLVVVVGSRSPVSSSVRFCRSDGSSWSELRSMCTSSSRLKEDVDMDRKGSEELVMTPRYLSKEQALEVQRMFSEMVTRPQWEMMEEYLTSTKAQVRKEIVDMEAPVVKLSWVGLDIKVGVFEELKKNVLNGKNASWWYTGAMLVGAGSVAVGARAWYAKNIKLSEVSV